MVEEQLNCKGILGLLLQRSSQSLTHPLPQILALKTMEHEGKTASYLMAFEVPSGRVLLTDTKISDHKLEGLEFS